ncbi:hypothetical protein HAX54_028102 [Datura stramonium]|uniref:Uncharacterized protein n=1 Tax=Datura stramonium TaxID=4076 RepID=A0ABS8V4E6_DATST|nr:hypothetical protein [Datura stramonium]
MIAHVLDAIMISQIHNGGEEHMTENGRIWLVWRKHLTLQVVRVRKQFIHCSVESPAENFSALITVDYARNKQQQRDIPW